MQKCHSHGLINQATQKTKLCTRQQAIQQTASSSNATDHPDPQIALLLC
jgi:hypothetical protein